MGIIAGVAFGIAFSQVILRSDLAFPLSPALLSLPLVSRFSGGLPVPGERLMDGVKTPCSLVLRSSVY